MDKENGKSGAELVNPYNDSAPKSVQVEKMFDSIAPAYDFMNTAMSFGMHRMWLRKSVARAAAALGREPYSVLDVATGTGDVAFYLGKKFPDASIVGIDLSEGMLDVARRKQSEKGDESRHKILFEVGDCLNLQFPSSSLDLVTVFYGVRNFENLRKGYEEMLRVLKPGGVLCVTELSRPDAFLPRLGYDIYSKYLIPTVGRLISGDSRAYAYLPESIAAAPQRKKMAALIREAGFRECEWESFTLGTVTNYIARK